MAALFALFVTISEVRSYIPRPFLAPYAQVNIAVIMLKRTYILRENTPNPRVLTVPVQAKEGFTASFDIAAQRFFAACTYRRYAWRCALCRD